MINIQFGESLKINKKASFYGNYLKDHIIDKINVLSINLSLNIYRKLYHVMRRD